MDKITLNELAPLLPHKLKFKDDREGFDQIYELTDRNLHTVMDNIRVFNNVKPLVRPLSQLTQEILREAAWTSFVDFMTIERETWRRKGLIPNHLPYEKVQWLLENHYDIFNWLGRGLAIPIEK